MIQAQATSVNWPKRQDDKDSKTKLFWLEWHFLVYSKFQIFSEKINLDLKKYISYSTQLMFETATLKKRKLNERKRKERHCIGEERRTGNKLY